jgi:hypothetical protein
MSALCFMWLMSDRNLMSIIQGVIGQGLGVDNQPNSIYTSFQSAGKLPIL